MRAPRIRLAALGGAAVLLAACGAGADKAAPPPSSAAPPATSPAALSTPAAADTAAPSSTPSAGCLSTADVAAWPVARRAASVVVLPSADFDFTSLAPELAAGAAGVLFLGSSTAPADLAARIHAAASTANAPGPLLVMADEEGGGVQRLKASVPNLPWPRDLAATSSTTAVRSQAATLGRALRKLGVNVDLAPVLDVDSRPGPSDDNPDGSRSFSGDPAIASKYGLAFLEGLRDGGVLPVVKHFPGLGGSTGNTDVRPAATVPLTQLKTTGVPPFQAAIAAGAPAVMISNATVPGLTTHPASLSSAVIGGLLGSQLGFTGLVVTDSLSAGAITAATPSLGQAVADAIESGADLVLFGSTRTAADVAALAPARLAASVNQILATMAAEVSSGALPEARLNAAVTQVLRARGVPLCG
jgi:beta-N-acetylhexosaminidase